MKKAARVNVAQSNSVCSSKVKLYKYQNSVSPQIAGAVIVPLDVLLLSIILSFSYYLFIASNLCALFLNHVGALNYSSCCFEAWPAEKA